MPGPGRPPRGRQEKRVKGGGLGPAKGVRPIMPVEREDALERIRRELISILEQGNKITERDLLRLSALTGVYYSTILRIEQEIPQR